MRNMLCCDRIENATHLRLSRKNDNFVVFHIDFPFNLQKFCGKYRDSIFERFSLGFGI